MVCIVCSVHLTTVHLLPWVPTLRNEIIEYKKLSPNGHSFIFLLRLQNKKGPVGYISGPV